MVLAKIDRICRSFIWTGTDNSKKSPVAWSTVCKPYAQGGLQILNIQVWNQVLMLKCLWNLCRMAENLWIKWMHSYYFHKSDVMSYVVKGHNSWIAKSILNQRLIIPTLQQQWDKALQQQKFPLNVFYQALIDDGNRVPWNNLIRGNKARPRAVCCLWLACHKRLATKVRLARLNLLETQDMRCCLCKQSEEDMDHVFFQCQVTMPIWRNILEWLEIKHVPQKWETEIVWITETVRKKGWRIALLKIAIAETVYSIWSLRNRVCFENIDITPGIEDSIKDIIVYRGWQHRKCRSHLAKLML